MHVVFNRLASALFRRLEQGAHVHVVAEVGKRGGHHFGATVVAVLTQLRNHHARTATMVFSKRGNVCLQSVPIFHGVSHVFAIVISRGINACDLLRVGTVTAKHFF